MSGSRRDQERIFFTKIQYLTTQKDDNVQPDIGDDLTATEEKLKTAIGAEYWKTQVKKKPSITTHLTSGCLESCLWSASSDISKFHFDKYECLPCQVGYIN